MIVKIKLNEEKVKKYNEQVKECRKGYPDIAHYFKEINKLEDEFIPYVQILKELDWDKYTTIEADYKSSWNFGGVYVCKLNSNHTIEALTDIEKPKILTRLFIGITMVYVIMLLKF